MLGPAVDDILAAPGGARHDATGGRRGAGRGALPRSLLWRARTGTRRLITAADYGYPSTSASPSHSATGHRRGSTHGHSSSAVTVVIEAVRGSLPGGLALAGIAVAIVGVAILNHPRAEASHALAALPSEERDGPLVERLATARIQSPAGASAAARSRIASASRR